MTSPRIFRGRRLVLGRVLRLREVEPGHSVVFRSSPLSDSSTNKTLYRTPCGTKPRAFRFPSQADSYHRQRRFGTLNDGERKFSEGQSLVLSSITETPLDSTVIEKPYTIVLMEDQVAVSPLLSTEGDENHSYDCAEHPVGNQATTSWIDTFRSKVPSYHGMSFASISLSWQRNPSVADGVLALKSCQLSSINDAILVTRGPVASLCAQYYLESFSLQGLVMIDPILIDDDEDACGDGEAVSSLVSRMYRCQDDDADKDRFRSGRLLVEPNSVPMMVVVTAQDDKAWNESSRFVAARHGDDNGPYGRVPIVDLANIDGTEKNSAVTVLDVIGEWMNDTL